MKFDTVLEAVRTLWVDGAGVDYRTPELLARALAPLLGIEPHQVTRVEDAERRVLNAAVKLASFDLEKFRVEHNHSCHLLNCEDGCGTSEMCDCGAQEIGEAVSRLVAIREFHATESDLLGPKGTSSAVAYLVAIVNAAGHFSIGVFSEEHPTMTGHRATAMITYVEGRDYEAARRAAIGLAQRLWPWMSQYLTRVR